MALHIIDHWSVYLSINVTVFDIYSSTQHIESLVAKLVTGSARLSGRNIVMDFLQRRTDAIKQVAAMAYKRGYKVYQNISDLKKILVEGSQFKQVTSDISGYEEVCCRL